MTVMILRGIPGSGKSTYAQKQKEKYPYMRVISADDYFIKDGVYLFDKNKLGNAHKECFTRALEWVSAGDSIDLLIVDNTNIEAWEMAPYVALGQVYNGSVEIVTLNVSPEVCIARNIHGVPPETIRNMHMRLHQAKIPRHWKDFCKVIP